MHRHPRRFRWQRGPRFFHLWRRASGLIWFFIVLMFVMGGGRWLPGLVICIGLAVVFGSLLRGESMPRTPQQPPAESARPIEVKPLQSPSPVESARQVDRWLPTHCPNCGGPIRASEVKWTGQNATCPFCNSNLPRKPL